MPRPWPPAAPAVLGFACGPRTAPPAASRARCASAGRRGARGIGLAERALAAIYVVLFQAAGFVDEAFEDAADGRSVEGRRGLRGEAIEDPPFAIGVVDRH